MSFRKFLRSAIKCLMKLCHNGIADNQSLPRGEIKERINPWLLHEFNLRSSREWNSIRSERTRERRIRNGEGESGTGNPRKNEKKKDLKK